MSTTPAAAAAHPSVSPAPGPGPDRLLRIQEVAEQVGLTARTIRYYEEVGLLEPAARSGGAYRLYDEDDLDRLRYIKAMRDDAGFSLAEIGLLLEDEQARSRSRERYLASTDAGEGREILEASAARLDRQASSLRTKRDRIDAMIDDVEQRRSRLERRLADLETAR